MPETADHLGRQTLAGAGNANERNALGRREAVITGFFGKCPFAQSEPIFQDIQTADVVGCLRDLVIFECLAFADDLLLFLGHE